VRDANGQALSYVYHESEPGDDLRRNCSHATKRTGSQFQLIHSLRPQLAERFMFG
jgi:hypothetical protein